MQFKQYLRIAQETEHTITSNFTLQNPYVLKELILVLPITLVFTILFEQILVFPYSQDMHAFVYVTVFIYVYTVLVIKIYLY